jgi:peptide-methionine (S)-S-oxide reductase
MMKQIIVAGGCFWGVEAYFRQLKGIEDTSVGYIDGNMKSPTYDMVCNGQATHAEACALTYDPKVLTIEKILDHLFRIIDPFSRFKQGHDVGMQYRTGVYYLDDEDEALIQNSFIKYFKDDIKRVKTHIKKATDYVLAENYHQRYLDKNPNGYCHVNLGLAKEEERHEK